VRGPDLTLTLPQPRRDGLSFVLSAGGRSAALFGISADPWTYDPTARHGDLTAGLAWQRGGTSTVLGYSQYDPGPAPVAVTVAGRAKSTRGVLGLSTRITLP
jgi:hypothetical protein